MLKGLILFFADERYYLKCSLFLFFFLCFFVGCLWLNFTNFWFLACLGVFITVVLFAVRVWNMIILCFSDGSIILCSSDGTIITMHTYNTHTLQYTCTIDYAHIKNPRHCQSCHCLDTEKYSSMHQVIPQRRNLAAHVVGEQKNVTYMLLLHKEDCRSRRV